MTDWFLNSQMWSLHTLTGRLSCFSVMTVSGFNLPIPEDLMIFAAAGLGRAQPE